VFRTLTESCYCPNVFQHICSKKKFFDAAGQLPRFFSVSSQRDDFRSYMHRSATNSDTRSLLDILKTMDQYISPVVYKFYYVLVTCPQTSHTAGRMISSTKWVTSDRNCSMTMHTGKVCPISFERDLSLNLNYDEIIEHCYKVRGHVVRVSRTNIAGSVEKGKEAKDAMSYKFSGTFHGLLEVNSRC